MIKVGKKNRIIFIDILRAFAVLQMIQGHTIDALLKNDYRNFDSLSYSIWYFMRGMTAPIFMFTAGTVFTYLLRLNQEPFENNPRVVKGLKRFLLLVFLGYLLKLPTINPFYIQYITELQLNIFYSVDVLQLIGFGLLFIILFSFISEKTKIGDTAAFFIGALLFVLPTPHLNKVDWLTYFPKPIANYFYTGAGSLFPLFPWVSYLLLGAILGSILAKNLNIFRSLSFSIKIIILGTTLILFIFIYTYFTSSTIKIHFDGDSYKLFIFRIGFVLVLVGLVSLLSQSLQSIPQIIILIGRNTLSIYIVHLLILYGSAVNPGLVMLYGNKLNPFHSIISAILMVTLMVLMVVIFYRLKIRNKPL